MSTSNDYKIFVCSIMCYCGVIFFSVTRRLTFQLIGYCVHLLPDSSVPKHVGRLLHSPTKVHTLMNDFPCIDFTHHIKKYFKSKLWMIHDPCINRMYAIMVQSTTRHFLSNGELLTETWCVHILIVMAYIYRLLNCWFL